MLRWPAPRVHCRDLVESRTSALMTGNELWIERAFSVTRYTNVDFRGLGQNRLLRVVIAVVLYKFLFDLTDGGSWLVDVHASS